MEIIIEKHYSVEEWNSKYPKEGNREKDIFIISINYSEKDYWLLTIDENFDIIKSYGFGLIDMTKPELLKEEILNKIKEYNEVRTV